jgi:mRNA-degrading endonuclease RelE of RelBE toxin-antitoxin system
MNFKLSKDFSKSLERLNGKELKSALNVLDEVSTAASIFDISDCKKLTNFQNVYRIRIGSRRAFFTFHIEIIDDVVFFRYLTSRGQAYDKAMERLLREKDKE